MTLEIIQIRRVIQLKSWLDNGYITLEQLMTIYNIGRDTMSNQQQYVCGRDESPETCFLCEQEGKDYCMICADKFTLEEYKTIQKEEQTS